LSYYGFRLDELYCIYQRSRSDSGGDSDIVTFAATVGQEPHGGVAGTFVCGSGNKIPASLVPTNIPGKFSGGESWILGPIFVEDGDTVELKYSGYNVGDLPEGSDEKLAPYELKMLGALYGAAAGEVLGPVAGAAASLVGGFGGVVEAILGFKPYVACDGLVFGGVKQFSGTDLSKLSYTESGAFNTCSFTNSYDDSATHDSACGHIAQTEITFSVINFGNLSTSQARSWFWPNVNFSKGIRQVIPAGKAASFKALFCS
jgi:hypothetical protein